MSQKKIESLIYDGNVLDDHGNWVPIAEKVGKERQFLSHLEKGEVLVDGFWIHLSAVASVVANKREPQLDHHFEATRRTESTHLTSAETPDETIDIPAEQVAEYINKPPESTDGDFPPETAEIRGDPPATVPIRVSSDTPVKNDKPFLFDGQTQVDLSIEQLTGKKEPAQTSAFGAATEFEETVLFNIKSIQAQIDEKKRRDGGTAPKK